MPVAKKAQWSVDIYIPDVRLSDVAARLRAWAIPSRAWPITVVSPTLTGGIIDGVTINITLGRHTAREAEQYAQWVVTNFTTWYRRDDIRYTCTPTKVGPIE